MDCRLSSVVLFFDVDQRLAGVAVFIAEQAHLQPRRLRNSNLLVDRFESYLTTMSELSSRDFAVSVDDISLSLQGTAANVSSRTILPCGG